MNEKGWQWRWVGFSVPRKLLTALTLNLYSPRCKPTPHASDSGEPASAVMLWCCVTGRVFPRTLAAAADGAPQRFDPAGGAAPRRTGKSAFILLLLGDVARKHKKR